MTSQPLFVLGAPRSGTTFLRYALNQHPLVHLTNEARIFVLLKELLEERAAMPHLLDGDLRDDFSAFFRRNAGELVERFYREQLGIVTPIWGDKHPSYGDPAVLSGRDGATMNDPASGSCLELIRTALPHAKFLHIHRHPWQVAASMKRRGWVESRAAGVQVWHQYVREIDAFMATLPEAQGLHLSHAELTRHPATAAKQIGAFLGLGVVAPIERFLTAQSHRPTPFSSPTTDLRRPVTEELSERGLAALRGVADVAWRFGYAD